MKFFIDTANIDEIKEANDLGLVDGVTTNPSLMAKENKPFRKILEEITAVVDGPISAEVVSMDFQGMLDEGRELSKIHKNIVVKLPMTKEGLKATKTLEDDGIRTNVTLIFSPLQALLAAKAGAGFISPFIGRLDDISHTGMELVAQIMQIIDNYAFESEVIVASVRSPLHVLDAAQIGAPIATIPFKVMLGFTKHPLTDLGIKRFAEDWEKAGGQKILA